MYYMSVSSENLNSVSIISNKSFISQSNLLPLLATPTWFARIAIQGIPSDKSGTKSVILIATGSNGICFIGLSLLPLYGYRYRVEEKAQSALLIFVRQERKNASHVGGEIPFAELEFAETPAPMYSTHVLRAISETKSLGQLNTV